MPVTYTNRKGLTYYLCRGLTKTGKPRYYFAREIKDEPLEEMPPGYTISESVNGIVSLVKDRPALIRPEEMAIVEAAVKRHPKGRNYRVSAKHNRIEVYERVGPDAETLVATLSREGLLDPGLVGRLQAEEERYGQFTAVLRFLLADAEKRTFGVQRMCYLGSVDDWIDPSVGGPLERLARELIPKLGTDRFFDLY
ncbi:MAG: hypothetical protein BroJett011_14130 [Chloroflexota bacterium]|nr:MAG: hypothetical protein BroJett011_14130 [Chloroflexota bacterium]